MRELNANQRLFAEEYCVDLNATKAAIRAGYSLKTSSRIGPELLGKPWIAEAIQVALEKRSKRVQRTADDVMKDLMLVRADAMQDNGAGQMVDRPSAIKTMELEGRHLAMFTDKVAHSGEMTLRAMSDDELDAKLGLLLKASK